ncbi:MAG: DUF4410 domain-containing protein [Lysobacterales bacterium]
MTAAPLRYSLLTLTLALAACGTTSNLQRSPSADAGASASAVETAALDFSRYSEVLVRDFVNQNSLQPEDAAAREALTASTDAACKRFADLIAEDLRKDGAFATVRREGEPTSDTLVIEGVVSRFDPSNPVKRIVPLVGSAEFDARVAFLDGLSGAELSFIAVDKNSSLLGGSMAAIQTVDTLLKSAAGKVSRETARAKKGLPADAQPRH